MAATVLAGCAGSGPASLALEEKYTTWQHYEGGLDATHYSALDQINKSNVGQLQVAWTYPMGDNTSVTFNPLVVDSIMYVVGRENSVVAIHAGTGREIWRNPLPGVPANERISDRGLMYWESEDRSERRVMTSKANYLWQIDALTGQLVSTFGTGGRIDLREGLGRDPRSIGRAQSDSPGKIFENLILMGSAPGESYSAGPGHLRAFDVRTGRQVWIFHTIPHPGEFGYETWPADAWQRVGGTNAWGGLSVDEERGILYAPLGSASYDFYGADRIGQNLFANSLVALDVRTGKRLWHYQTVHHDLWDYDLVTTPTLLTIRHEGRARDVVAQASKQGWLFVFDRVTGEPIWPIEEVPQPASTMPGEKAWPTQPIPTWPRPFAVQSFTMDDINPYLTPGQRDTVIARLREIGDEALKNSVFTPPSTRPTMQMPGNAGGSNWGTSGADPTEGSYFVITKNLPTVLQLSRILPGTFGTGTSAEDRGQFIYQQNCTACHQANFGGTPPLIPSLANLGQRMDLETFRSIVNNGRSNMPAFPDLSAQEISSIYAYINNPAGATLSAAAAGQQAANAGPVAGEDSGPIRYQTGYGYFSVPGGMYARKPPFTTMTKYDLNTGEIAWQIPIGEVPSLLARGITDNTGGAQFAGGPAITAGGLVFVTTQNKLRAYDKDTGRELWNTQLPAGADGIPTVYEYAGRQYVAVSANSGGGGPGAGQSQRAYVAFALPQR